MIAPHYAREHGWSAQKLSDTNRLLDRSHEEFMAHLKKKPVWRGPCKHNSLTQWFGSGSFASLDTTTFHSPPSSALLSGYTASLSPPYNTIAAAQLVLYGGTAPTYVPQGYMTAWFRCVASVNGVFWLMRVTSGALSQPTTYYAAWTQFGSGGGVSGGLDQVSGGAFVTLTGSGQSLSFSPNTWTNDAVTFWSDPTLGFIVRMSELSPTPQTLPDVFDVNDALKTQALNKVGMGQSNGSLQNAWFDDFQLFTP